VPPCGHRPIDPEAFDAAVSHRVVSHVPDSMRVLVEAFRVLRPRPRLARFDGDYATITVAIVVKRVAGS
jgi:ubiquinone/menaquinone biosynthesis C-methylase UbiE